jgi:hypothetical protein
MRTQAILTVGICLIMVASAAADGLVYRLPEDGMWARYSIKETMTLPNNEKETFEGTLTLASVGQEKIEDEVCRWLEIVIDADLPGQKLKLRRVFKALVPKKYLKKGEDPLAHWVKGWVKLGNQPPQALTKELLSNPAMMINLFVTGPLQEAKVVEAKAIETGLGRLTCEGASGALVLKDAAVSVQNGKVQKRDIKVRVENYHHNKSPFGVVSARLDVEFPDFGDGDGKPSAEVDLILVEIGSGAKSELPDQK